MAAPEQAISIDHSNNVFVENYGKETLSEFAGTTMVTGASGAPYTVQANLTKPEFQVTDGAGNLWVTGRGNHYRLPGRQRVRDHQRGAYPSRR